MEREVEEWCTKMRAQHLEDLCKPYSLVAEAHQDLTSPLYYEFSIEAKEVCFSFSDEMTTIMNNQWESRKNTHGNVSKDKRTMIRSVLGMGWGGLTIRLHFCLQTEWSFACPILCYERVLEGARK